MNDALELLTQDDLTPDLSMLAEVCGIDTIKLILKNFPAMSFYIPKIAHLEKFIKKYIMLYPEKNTKILAKELNVSEQFLKNMMYGIKKY
jgi:hypothetical protein